jgi:peptidoglycan DL-endopeptidase CwlO
MPTRSRPTRRLTAAAVGALALATVIILGPAAGIAAAAPAAPSLDQQAKDIQTQIESSDLQISGLAEKLDAAQARRDTAQQTVSDAEAKITEAKKQVDRVEGLVRQNLASLYRRTLRGSSVGAMDFSSTLDLLKRGRYAKAQESQDDDLLGQLSTAQSDLAIQRESAAQARDTAATESQQISDAKGAVEAARAQQQGILDKVKGQLAAAVAAERARREQAARAVLTTKGGGNRSFPDVGPPNGSSGQAISYARGAIGAGYSTNPRMGPDTYDCSGLVYSAWHSAGVSIPSSSGSMYAALPHVSMDALQAGDLIFWGSGGGDHVALYIGGGQIIDAGNSSGVSQRGIWGSPVGAARVL